MAVSEIKHKIALVGFGLGKGGAEKVMANLSVFFDYNNLEVHHIIINNCVSYNFKGKLLNLGLYKDNKNSVINKLKRFCVFKEYIKKNNFDYIIDFRPRTKFLQELIVSRLVYKRNTIYTIHSYLLEYYIPKSKILGRFLYKDAFSMVTITKQSEEMVSNKYAFSNVTTIYNPFVKDDVLKNKDETIDFTFNFIIAVGEMETNFKQFDQLIIAYSKSELPLKNIHLVILGDGQKQQEFKNLTIELNISDKVHFLGYKNNPYKYMSKALFFVLSSLYEGLPNVIIESLACGTPVIAFDCPSGPREILTINNGILVENQNFSELTIAMNKFATNAEFYAACKEDATKSINKFDLQSIGNQWLKLMNIN